MSKNLLFTNDSDSDHDTRTNFQLNTNKDYAKSYNKFRSKELLKKHQDRNPHAAKATISSSDDSDTSSDDDEILNPKFDEAFYKTLATLKRKDPSIYTGTVKNYFEECDIDQSNKKGIDSKSKKALTIKDYERKILLEKGGIYDDDDNIDDDDNKQKRPESPTYVQDQDNLRKEFKKVINQDSDDDEEFGGILKKRIKSKQEADEDDANYSRWLAGEVNKISDEKAETLAPLKDYWSSPRLTKEEKFLRDYILSNGYSNHDRNQVPTYDEIVGDDPDTIDDVSEDEAELEKQAEFEQKFNFRFEEPDQEFIKRYPRTIEHSVRQTDTRRKEKRVEIKERKAKEKEQKMKELEMINAVRKKEIEEKLAQLRKVSGEEEFPFDDMDLDADFDPDEYDRKMQKVFNNDYYQIDEGEEKPDVPSDIEDLKVDDWDNFDPKELHQNDDADAVHCEDDDFNMDLDYVPQSAQEKRKLLQDELIENSRDRRKRRKRQSKFVEMLKREKPAYDPNDAKTYGEYLDEYYKLDYEDVIGDVPCRFKYTETVPNDFGLTIEEILMAKNKELNQWASLKKATQIRPEHVERNEVKMFHTKSKNQMLKRKIFPSLYEEPSNEEPEPEPELVTIKGPSKIKPNETVTKATIVTDKTVQMEEIVDVQESKTKAAETKPPDSTKNISPTKSSKKKSKANKLPPSGTSEKSNLNSNKPKKLIQKEKKPNYVSIKPKATPMKSNSNNVTAKKDINKQKLKPGKLKQKKQIVNKTMKPKSKPLTSISDERLRAFGINPKKFHKKQKYTKTTAAIAAKPSPKSNSKKPLSIPSSSKQIKDKLANDKKLKDKLKKFLNTSGGKSKI